MAAETTTSKSPATGGKQTEFTIAGMTCSGCVRNVTEAIRAVPGVEGARVELDPGRAFVRWQRGASPAPPAVVQAVEKAGYEATPAASQPEPTGGKNWSPLTGWRFNSVVGAMATAPLIVGEWVLGLGMERWFHWFAFAVALPVQVICGARFYRGAWMQLKRGSSNMDTLVALGSTTAFAYSVWALFSGAATHLYFMEAAAIITLISIGHFLESKASARAAGALRSLLDLAPPTARLQEADGSEKEVPAASLQREQVFLLKPGDRVPTDAEIIDGESAVDESMLTGESLPVDKQPGMKIYGGTVNVNGRLSARVTATGESTALAQIISVVERAQNSRAEIQKLGDRVSSVFVPVVVLIALGIGLWWGLAPASASSVSFWLSQYLWPVRPPETALAAAVIHAAAVLIIACPCAMGLATPIAIMAGTNAAARRGILIRDGVALEKTGHLSAVVFDKTGTLTEGRLVVEEWKAIGEEPAGPSPRAVAVALAKPSNHPISQAVAQAGDTGNLPPLKEWQEIRGAGVSARLASGQTAWKLGSLNWLRESGVSLEAAQPFIDTWADRGATLLGLVEEKELRGVLALRDSLRPGAQEVIRTLGEQNKTTFLITGDNQRTAQAIAAQVGIAAENVFAEVRPEKKADIVKELQQRGMRVAFVGDGINDAPALEQADLGIAVAKASDVAREAADIILLKSEITAIPEALGLAQATLRTIKQNLFWAFFYNAAGIPLAALGFLSPVLCAAAMGLSDLVVIGNALRLRRWKRN